MHGNPPHLIPASTTVDLIDDELIRQHLDDVVASAEFSGSERRRQLLKYLVDETLEGRGDALKAYRIGRIALARPSGFDPQTDPIVRVEIGRLRATLDRYYRSNPTSQVVISIPKGSYAAEFEIATSEPERPHPANRSGIMLQIEPFTATSPAADDLAHGIMESIATLTAKVLRDPASVLVGTAKPRTAPDAGTDTVCRLTGAVRTVGDRVRVIVQGFTPGSDRPLWVSHFDDSLADHPFDVIDRLAERVTWELLDDSGALARCGLRIADRGATDAQRNAQLRYYQAFDSVDPDAIAGACGELQQVISSNGADARATAALSDTMTTAWFLSAELGIEILDRAEELAIRALALDPRLVEAHLALAYVHFSRRRTALMQREFDVAMELAPPSPTVLLSEAIVHALDGSWEKAEPLMAHGVELNPALPKYWRLVPCIAALHRELFEEAYSQSLQIGDSIGWAGPALRLASALPLRLPLAEDLKQFEAMAPDPAVQPYDRTVARCFHDPLVQTLVLSAIAAGRSASV